MSIVATSPSPSKRPSRRRRARRVLIPDFSSFLYFRRHVDMAERELQRAREARAKDEREQAVRMVRAFGRTCAQMYGVYEFGRAVGRLYAEQSARLVEIANAVDELERDAEQAVATVVCLDDFRARRAAKAVRA